MQAFLEKIFHHEPAVAKKHLLFVCTESLQRSPTAAHLFKKSKKFDARFCGTNPLSPTPVTQELIDWADLVFVMSEREDGHMGFLRKFFNVYRKRMYDLDIPKTFSQGDNELKSLLRTKLSQYVQMDS